MLLGCPMFCENARIFAKALIFKFFSKKKYYMIFAETVGECCKIFNKKGNVR
jgi:hypothetical protein